MDYHKQIAAGIVHRKICAEYGLEVSGSTLVMPSKVIENYKLPNPQQTIRWSQIINWNA